MAARKVLIQVDVDDGQATPKVTKLTNAFDQLDEHTTRSSSGLRSVFLQADLAARGVALLTREVAQTVQEYLRFNRELANLNTLLDDGAHVEHFRAGLVRLDPHLGATSELARGMYQAISSGVDAGDALQFIEDSAKAARAGLATTFETVDAGTTVLNSFKLEAKDATMVYDKMFEVVKRGKVEMPQLAQSIGLVANIAAQSGVTLDEMFAVIATASTTIRPAQAIEGFRTMLANILKPSEQALEVARRLGVEFSEDALRSKGLASFLNDITTAAGGNKEALARLFGDVQALNVVMAVTGNRAETLAKDLKGIAAASGTVEEAFRKQKESIPAQLEALRVTLQQFLIKTFMLVEPLITGLLSLVNKYPAVFAAATVALMGLVAAHVLWNTQLVITAGTYIPQLIANLRNLITVMFAFSQVTSLSATGMAAFAAGWAGVAIAIGIVIIALIDFESAADKANQITLDQIAAQEKALSSGQELADLYAAYVESIKQVSFSQEESAEKHAQLEAILGRLDPATAAYIRTLNDEAQQLDVIKAKIKEIAELNRPVLEASLRAIGNGILDQQSRIELLQSRIKVAQQEITRAQQALSAGQSFVVESVGEHTSVRKASEVIQTYSDIIVELDQKLVPLKKELGDNEIKLLENARALSLTRDQLIQFFLASGRTAEAAKTLADRYDALTPKIDKTNEALREQVLTIDGVRQALKALKETGDFEIEQQVLDIVKQKKSAEESRRLAQEALKNDPELRKKVEERRAYNAAEKAARDVFDPETNRDGSLKTKRDRGNPVQSLTDDVRKLRAEVEALQRNGGVLYKLKIEKSELEQTKSDLENILKLRRQLSLPLTAPLPRDLAGIREETRTLTEQKKIVEAVTEARHAQSSAEFALVQLILTRSLPLVNLETRAQTKYLQAVRERANAELDLTADLSTAVRLRREALESEQSTLRDTRQQYTQMRLEAVRAAEQARLADIRSQIEFAIAFGQEPALQQRLQVELNKESDQIKPPIVEMNDNVKTMVKQLEAIVGALTGKSGGSTASGAHWTLDKAKGFIEAQGFQVISTTGGRHNQGSLHYLGRALDVRTRGKSAAEIESLIAVGRDAGLNVLDERTRPKGQKVWGGPHLHFSFDPQSGRRDAPPPPAAELEDGAIEGVVRTAADTAGVNLVDERQRTRLLTEITLQRNAITDLKNAEQDLRNARAADLALREHLLATDKKTLEQKSIEAALDRREQSRLKDDLAAATAAGVVEHDLALARVQDAQYVQRVTVDAERARAAAAKSTQDQIIADEAHLFALQSGNAEALRQLHERAQAARVQGHVSLYGEIAKLEDQIAHAGEDSSLRHRVAWLQAIRGVQEASEQAAVTQIQAQVKLADATIYHADRADARVQEFLASQKSVTDSIADFKIGLIQSGFDTIDRAFQKLIGSGNVLKRLLADLLSNLAKLAVSKFLSPLFGGGQSNGGNGGGNLLGNLFGLLRGGNNGGNGALAFAGLPGGFAGGPGAGQFLGLGGGAGITGPQAAQARALENIFRGAPGNLANRLTPPVSLTDQQQNTGQFQQLLGQAQSTTTGALVSSSGGFSLSGLAQSIGPLAPLLGVALGASLGGSSRTGSILGAAGGGIAGLGVAALLGSSSAASALGSITTLGGILPFALPILPLAGALIVGALLLRRNAARRRDETTRNQGMLDALGQLDEILRAVKTDRMDGGAALASAAQIRSQYLEAMSALKDKKTREIALRDVSRLDLKIAQIRGESNLQLERREIDEKLVPEFASGGFTPGMTSLIKVRPGELFLPPEAQLQLARNGGFIPGPDYGRDNTFMFAPANSLVVPQSKAPSVSVPALTRPSAPSGSGTGEQRQPTISIGELVIQATKVEVDQDAGRVTVTGLRTAAGKDEFTRTFRALSDEGRLR